MRIKLKNGEQRRLFNIAIKKARTEKNLSKLIRIPESSIYSYKNEKRTLPLDRFHSLINFLNIKQNSVNIDKFLDDNWGKIKGGKKVVLLKKARNTFDKDMERLKKLSSIRMKEWHRKMKNEDPESYYKLQYKRFKKIGRYPFLLTKNGLKVRNCFEKQVADFLYISGISFIYEPYLNINKKAYFPDFLVNDTIIEVTAWKHPDKFKLSYLKKKIKDYLSSNYKIIFFIPKQYRNFYKDIDYLIISDLKILKSKIMPS